MYALNRSLASKNIKWQSLNIFSECNNNSIHIQWLIGFDIITSLFLVVMTTKLEDMAPKSEDEIIELAKSMEESSHNYNTHIYYKQFINDLVGNIYENLDNQSKIQVKNHLSKLAMKRKKEERARNVHVVHSSDEDEEDEQHLDQTNNFDEFM